MSTRAFVEIDKKNQVGRTQERNSVPRLGNWIEVTNHPKEKEIRIRHWEFYLEGEKIKQKTKITPRVVQGYFDGDNPARVEFDGVPEDIESFEISIKGHKRVLKRGEPFEAVGNMPGSVVEVKITDSRLQGNPVVLIGKRNRNARRSRRASN